MKTYYHVAPPDYEPGEHLFCASRLIDMGYEMECKWGEDWPDMDVVCLFDTRADAEDFRAEFVPDGRLLIVTLDEDDPEIRMTTVAEGYKAVYNCIPAEYIAAAA